MTDADVVRTTLSDLLGREADEAILAPGALVALRLFFHHQNIHRVLLSDREYYAAGHFPGLEVHVAPFDELVDAAQRFEPDAVIASLVSWRGQVGDVEALGRALRKRFAGGPGPRRARPDRSGGPDDLRPLLFVDWCHAGAAGFPSAAGLPADVVFGDASKWLIPATTSDRIAFLLGSDDLVGPLRSCFEGLHESGGGRTAREARWIDGRTLEEAAQRVRGAAADRGVLEARHSQNMELARAIAEANDRPPPATALLWFPDAGPADLDLSPLPSSDLAWETEAGVRVLCQASP